MKLRFSLLHYLVAGFWLLCQTLTTHAQLSAPFHALDLDGNGTYIELPPHIFDDLSNATVEAWVKWDLPPQPDGKDRMFFCFGVEGFSLFVGADHGSSAMKFVIYDIDGIRHP